jgi:hypothetical protein
VPVVAEDEDVEEVKVVEADLLKTVAESTSVPLLER